jgi:RNA polymerase sigma-70 factor (ECF subfamily)
MVVLRADPRMKGRIDPSDVLQDAYLEAVRRLPEYLRDPAVPFFLWLRFLVGTRLNKLHRRHLGARMRDAGREVSLFRGFFPAASSAVLATHLLGRECRPSEAMHRVEQRLLLQASLDRLDPLDREVLALRHFEQLSTTETAGVLGISPAAASKRYVRALGRLRNVLARLPGGLHGVQS